MKEYRVLNLGAGVQSTALFLLSREPDSKLKFDLAIFADTGEEPASVYKHLEYLQSLGDPIIWVRSAGIRGTDILLAPHHGREAGYSADLFKHINPWLVVVSDGSFSDTSATARYSGQARGLRVQRRTDKTWVERKCVTTRSDDYITVELGTNAQTRDRYIHVTID